MGKNTMSVKIIAEIANSHQGKYLDAIKLAKECFKYNADAVKFQIYFASELISKNHPRFNHFKKQSFSKTQWKRIFKSLRKFSQTKEVYTDVFGVDALKFAIKAGVDGVKIHSSDLSNIKIIKNLKKYKKKIFISCGGSSLLELENAVKNLSNKNLIFLHGFQSYPTSIKDVNFKKLKKIKNFFGEKYHYGYQDHTSGSSAFNFYLPLVSLGIGINYIEKHVTLNRRKKGIDYFSSIEPKIFKKFVNIIKKSEETLNDGLNWYSKKEYKYRQEVKKNWVLKKNLKKNNILKLDDVEMLRHPQINIHPLNLPIYLNKKLQFDVKKDSIIKKSHFKNNVCVTIVARSKSKRLKHKASLKIADTCVLDHLFKKVKMLKNIDNIIFCTTKDKSDDALIKLAKKNKIQYFRGSTLNVLDRIMQPLKKIKPDVVIRITGDDILIDNENFQVSLDYFLQNNFDYVDNKKLIGGTETEIFDYNLLKFIYKNAQNLDDTEYLTNYIKDNSELFNIGSSPVKLKKNNHFSMTIDTKEDYEYVKKFLEKYYEINKNYYNYTYKDVFEFCKNFPRNLKNNNNKLIIKSMLKKY